jgi:hypothetical protein
MTDASDTLVESVVSSLAGSPVEEGASRLNDFSVLVCKENLNIMANNQSHRCKVFVRA